MYRLQKYNGAKSRFNCPKCNKPRVFTRYVNLETDEHLSPLVGICDRETNCGYKYSPQQYFKDNEIIKHELIPKHWKKFPINKPDQEDIFSSLPQDLVKASILSRSGNHFHFYLKSLFGDELTDSIADKYLIGTSNRWPGATVFFQKDIRGIVRTGKIMLYDKHTGLRVKDFENRVTWAHASEKFKGYVLKQCLFGEHLLSTSDLSPIAIVESEKTAIIASVYFPQYKWLATGGLKNFKAEMFFSLKGHSVYAFPDLGGFDIWKATAKVIEQTHGLSIVVSDFLERHSSDSEKQKGYDLADFLINRDPKFGWALTADGYPIFWDA